MIYPSLLDALSSPPSEKTSEICLILFPQATFEVLAVAAEKRNLAPAQALAEAVQLWLQKESS